MDFIAWFRRPRTTLIIIVALTGLYLAGLFIPQKVFFGSQAHYDSWKSLKPGFASFVEYFTLNEIYTAPVTVVILGLFFLNLFFVTAAKIPTILLRMRFGDGSIERRDLSVIKNTGEVVAIIQGREQRERISRTISRFFRKRFWTVLSPSSGHGMIAIRNRYSPLGFILFHVSFVLCLFGGLLVTYTRFSANMTVTEGEQVTADMGRFRKINHDAKIFRELPAFGIKLEKVTPAYDGNIGTDLDIRLELMLDNRIEPVTVKTNYPVKSGSLSILANAVGVSPLLILRNKAGQEVAGGYIALNVYKGEEDAFEFPSLPYRFFVRFYPDHAREHGRDVTRSLALKNPAIALRVERSGKTVRTGTVPLSQEIAFDNYRLEYRDTRYWVDFLVIREYGNLPLYIGFILGAVGLVMRLVFYQKEVALFFDEGADGVTVYAQGRSDYFPESFRDERAVLLAELKYSLETEQPAS